MSQDTATDIIAATTESTNNTSFKKATIFINIGYPVTMPDGSEQFVSLPFGLGLDNMTAAKTDTSNPEFNALNQAKNQLLQDLLEAAQGVKPGTGVIINDLSLELRVKAQPAQTDAGSNPFMKRKAFTIAS